MVGSILGVVVGLDMGGDGEPCPKIPENCNLCNFQNYLEDLHDWVKDSDVTPSHPQR